MIQKIIWFIQLIINCAFMLYFAAKLSNAFFIDSGLSIIITIFLILVALIIAYVLTSQFKDIRRWFCEEKSFIDSSHYFNHGYSRHSVSRAHKSHFNIMGRKLRGKSYKRLIIRHITLRPEFLKENMVFFYTGYYYTEWSKIWCKCNV